MFATPNVGDVVTVTTRYSEGYIYADSEWRDTTYENVTVIRGPDWKPSGSFCVPCEGEPYITFRTIAMKNVHEILINGHPGKTVEETVYQTVEVNGSKGNIYIVTLENGVAQHCECVGFKFRTECMHLKLAEQAVLPEVVDILPNSVESTRTTTDLLVN